jgi:hypothetical protein
MPEVNFKLRSNSHIPPTHGKVGQVAVTSRH